MSDPTFEQLVSRDIFDCPLLNDRENEFVFEHAGIPPHLALEAVNIPMHSVIDDEGLPAIVPEICLPMVQAILNRFIELDQIFEAKGRTWIGIEPVRERIRLWLDWYRVEYIEAQTRAGGKGHHPSMSTYTSRGEAIYGGVGADRGRVRTYFDSDGVRQPWALNLVGDVVAGRLPNFARLPAAGAKPPAKDGGNGAGQPAGIGSTAGGEPMPILIDEERGVMTCPVPECYNTETWKPARPRDRNLAKGRMIRHCQIARDEKSAHRLVVYEARGQ